VRRVDVTDNVVGTPPALAVRRVVHMGFHEPPAAYHDAVREAKVASGRLDDVLPREPAFLLAALEHGRKEREAGLRTHVATPRGTGRSPDIVGATSHHPSRHRVMVYVLHARR